MLGFGGLHITIRIFFWIWTFRSANLSNCKFFSANYSKEKISEAVRCFPAFSLKRTNSYIWVLLSGNKEIEARRTSSEKIILRFCNHFFITCSRCPQTRELKQTRRRRKRKLHLKMWLGVSAIIFKLFKLIMLEKCVLTILELNWNQRLGHKKTKLNICQHTLTLST